MKPQPAFGFIQVGVTGGFGAEAAAVGVELLAFVHSTDDALFELPTGLD